MPGVLPVELWLHPKASSGPAGRASRKATWAIEDLEQDIGLVYRAMGLQGLQAIPNVGPSIAREVEGLIKVWMADSRQL